MEPERPFLDRASAGRQLAQALMVYAYRPDVAVLGLPRGGIPVAYEIAMALGLPLAVYLVRKLGVPNQPELAMGAIATGGVRYLNPDIIAQSHVSPMELETITHREQQELDRRDRLYRQGRPPLPLNGKIIILTDDGIATGATMFAALSSLRQYTPQKLVAAIPVAPAESEQALRERADEVVCLRTPSPFYAVGQWYNHFEQVGDEEVCRLLNLANANP
ncbi:MAG: phosphoribosyltransferase [Thermosynechococcaceae cyanobacterium]